MPRNTSGGSQGKNNASGGIFAISSEKDVSYINFTIKDASTVIHKKIKTKIEEKQSKISGSILIPPESFRERVADRIASKISDRVPPKVIAKQLAKRLPKMIMYSIATKTGMRVAAETVFLEDSYIVVQFQIKSVDSQKLLDMAKGSGKGGDVANDNEPDPDPAVVDEWIRQQLEGNKSEDVPDDESILTACSVLENEVSTDWKVYLVSSLEWIIEKLIPEQAMKRLEENRLPAIVQTKITEQMQSMMKGKLAKKGLQADVVVLPSKDQSRYFFSQLSEIRTAQDPKEK